MNDKNFFWHDIKVGKIKQKKTKLGNYYTSHLLLAAVIRTAENVFLRFSIVMNEITLCKS